MGTDLLKKSGIFFSSLFVTASAVYLYSPVVSSHADSETADVSIEVGEIMSLTLDKSNLALQADVNSFVSGTIAASVTTNAQYGYTLTFEDTDASTDMVHSNPSVNSKISSDFEGTKTSSTMADNTWGFSLDATEYSKIPANGASVTIKTTSTPSATVGDTTTITVGTKVGNITAGSYTDSLLFTAFTNGANSSCEGGDFFCISNMQEMTTSICNATTTPSADASNIDWDGSHAGDTNYIPRATLVDTRDNKTYLVSKFADGACWMSQNLDLELSNSVALTSADTDLNSKASWTPSKSTATTLAGFAMPAWWDESINHTGNSYRSSTAYYAGGTTASAIASTNDGTSEWEKVGIYYDQDAATAESDQSIYVNFDSYDDEDYASKTAPDSICPKGWRLPTAINSTDFGDYGAFHTAYGYDRLSQGLYNSKYAFTATGRYYQSSDTPYFYNNDNKTGYYQTSVVANRYYQSGFAIVTEEEGMGVSSTDSSYRHDGYQVRCIAR